jgi:hypothetical protein
VFFSLIKNTSSLIVALVEMYISFYMYECYICYCWVYFVFYVYFDRINPKKQRSIQGKIESLLASDIQLKEFAQRVSNNIQKFSQMIRFLVSKISMLFGRMCFIVVLDIDVSWSQVLLYRGVLSSQVLLYRYVPWIQVFAV